MVVRSSWRTVLFESNIAEMHGGGFAISTDAEGSSTSTTFHENTSYLGGGAVGVIEGLVTMINANCTGNRTSISSGFGGALLVIDGTGTVQSSLFQTNEAYYGGAFAHQGSGMITVIGTSVCGNLGGHDFGNVDYLGTGNCVIYDCMMNCSTDLNGDQFTDINDLLTMMEQWGDCPAVGIDCDGDIDLSHRVGIEDMLTVIAGWGSCP